MKNIKKYIIFTYILTFIFIFNVNAECSYQERKDMLNEAKNIEAYFEADLKNNKFVFYLYNLTDNIYVSLENISSNESKNIYKYMYDTEYYTYDENNINDIINYKLKIYSNKSGCYGNSITTKSIKKPMINKYYKEDICKGIEDYKYCVPLLNNKINLSDEKIYNAIKEYKESISIEEETKKIDKFGLDDLLKILTEYWYFLIIIIFIIILIFLIKFIIKKRGELK